MATLKVHDKHWNKDLEVPDCVLNTIYFSIIINFEQPGNESQTSTLVEVLKDVCTNHTTVKNGNKEYEITEANVQQLVNKAKTHESEIDSYKQAIQNRAPADGVKLFNTAIIPLHSIRMRAIDGRIGDEIEYQHLNAFGNHFWGTLVSFEHKRIAAQKEQERA